VEPSTRQAEAHSLRDSQNMPENSPTQAKRHTKSHKKSRRASAPLSPAAVGLRMLFARGR
jgi:hypothetical protein